MDRAGAINELLRLSLSVRFRVRRIFRVEQQQLAAEGLDQKALGRIHGPLQRTSTDKPVATPRECRELRAGRRGQAAYAIERREDIRIAAHDQPRLAARRRGGQRAARDLASDAAGRGPERPDDRLALELI